jgi:2-oxoglutarate ferredoxin oxidoreductase subunit alpha
MQLTGDRFTSDAAFLGNDLSTLPNFPAEIRAPQGTIHGVSSFQLHFADHDVLTPGDAPDVLVAMNPAALKANLADLPRGATIIVDTDEFTKRNLAKVGLCRDAAGRRQPGELPRARPAAHLDHRRRARRAPVDPQGQGTGEEHVRPGSAVVAVHPADVDDRAEFLSKFAGSPTCWLPTWPPCGPASPSARPPRTSTPIRWPRPRCPTGTYRNITGNVALSYGLVAAAHQAGLR